MLPQFSMPQMAGPCGGNGLWISYLLLGQGLSEYLHVFKNVTIAFSSAQLSKNIRVSVLFYQVLPDCDSI
jgi:hypothetical protein